MSKIFGGSKSKSKSRSYNQAYGAINSSLGPVMGYAGTGAAGLNSLLSGDFSQFNAFKNASGFDQIAEYGSRGVTGNAAARGLLRSGSTSKSLASFYNMLQNQYLDSFMNKQLGLAGIGVQAGNVLANAGQVSESSSKSKNKKGIGGFLGGLLSGGASG